MTELLELVQNGKWDEAEVLAENLRQTGETSEEFMILYATICGAQGDVQREYEEICHGLQNYPQNYELYYMLGNHYMRQQHSSLAYLCYEQANHYCVEPSDGQMILESMELAAGQPDFEVNPVSIVILAGENSEMLRDAVQSVIQNECGTLYEILVVDNQCLGKDLEWLGGYEQVKLISCPEKVGFAEGANTGIKRAEIYNDIYLMSSNAILLPNTLFWLRMGLYERETIGAAGGISNRMPYREFSNQVSDEYARKAEKLNVPGNSMRENKLWLEPFSLLLRREAVDNIGLFEGKMAGSSYSAMDYGMKLMKADYERVLCYNSFIFRQPCIDNYYTREGDTAQFEKKWNFQIMYYANSRKDMVKLICREPHEEIAVLEVGCGCGSTLSAIRCQYPNARVQGIELMENVAAAGKYMADIIVGNIETMELPFEEHVFDYIIFGDVLEHLRNPGQVLKRLKKYLRSGGRVLASIPNVMNIEIVVSLLQGNFTYREEGLMDRTHIHMFTLSEIVKMFEEAGYKVEHAFGKNFREGILEDNEQNRKMIDAVYQIEGIARRSDFEVYQWGVECVVCDS